MEALDRTSDVGELLVTTLELFTVSGSLLFCDNKFRFGGMCLAPKKTPSDHHNLIGQLAEN
jgi:hypothetical protein